MSVSVTLLSIGRKPLFIYHVSEIEIVSMSEYTGYTVKHTTAHRMDISREGETEGDIQAYLILIVEIRSENTPAKSRQANCSNQ